MKRALSMLTALVVALSFSMTAVPQGAYAGEAVKSDTDERYNGDWSSEIPDMLEAGGFEEGAVIVCMDTTKEEKNGAASGLRLSALSGAEKDAGTASGLRLAALFGSENGTAASEELLGQAEKIMTIDPDVVEAAADDEDASSAQDISSDDKKKSKADAGRKLNSTSEAEVSDEAGLMVIRSGMSTKEMLEILSEDERVLFAEPNYTWKIEDAGEELQDETPAGQSSSSEASSAESLSEDEAPSPVADPADVVTADDLTPQQWSSSDKAELRGEAVELNPSINVPDFGATGSDMSGEPVGVAVIDLAVDFSHPDLKDTAYTFTPEEQAMLGCDAHGYNATWQSEDGKLTYYPGDDHGTHCAGIIGASWDGKGISGVASNVRMISLQISTGDGKTSLVNVLRACAFVKRANEETGVNIRITSNSWGLNQYSKAMDAAFRDLGESQGVVSVIAAGNSAEDLAEYEVMTKGLADDPYVVLVASTDPAGRMSSFSNYGEKIVHLGAPGSGVLSCMLTGSKAYIPDAVKASNKLFEGFDDSEQSAEVCLVDGAYAETGSASICGKEGMTYAGEHALRLSVTDAEYAGYYGYPAYRIRLSFGDVKSLGVKAGDTIGFSYGGGAALEPESLIYKSASTGEMVQVTADFNTYSSYNTWNYYNAAIPEDADLSDLTIYVNMFLYGSADSFYVDSIGIGEEKVPYGMKSGTSMACPAAAGAAAVLAARHDEAAGDGSEIRGRALAELVRRSVRPMESLQGVVKTGGIIDLSAEALTGDAQPVISGLRCVGRTVTLTGSGFGAKPGSVALTKEVIGAAPEKIDAWISSWSDAKVTLTLKKDFRGVIKAVLTTANVEGTDSGALRPHDTISRMISLSENIYGGDLPLNMETGDPFEFDAPGDAETKGILKNIGDRLYYMPATTKVEVSPAWRDLYALDLKEDAAKAADLSESAGWEKLAPLPVWLERTSAAVRSGILYVKGTLMDTDASGEIPSSSSEQKTVVYAYDPGSDSWTEAGSQGLDARETLVAAGDDLLLAGTQKADSAGVGEKEALTTYVRTYDPAGGAGAPIAQLKKPGEDPEAAVSGGVLYVFSAAEYSFESVSLAGLGKNTASGTGSIPESKDLSSALPEYAGDPYGSEPETRRDGVLLPVEEGVLLIGPAHAGGESDTYLLEAGTTSFIPSPKRVSDGEIDALAAAVAGKENNGTVSSEAGSVYVIGSCVWEPGQRFFRTDSLANILPKKAPEKTAVKSVKKGKRSFTVTWQKRQAPVKGYQIRYSLKKNMKSAKSRTVAKASASKLKVKGLKKNRKYYVQVRTYKVIAGKKIYSGWSGKKSVKVR